MKKMLLASAIALSVSTAYAGGVAEPVMETAVIAERTSSSAAGIVVPLLLLLLVAALVTSGSDTPVEVFNPPL